MSKYFDASKLDINKVYNFERRPKAMYEIIELATGKSHYFEHCQCKCCLQYFELPPTLPESFPSLPGLVRLAIESEIRGGDFVSWYGGIYVRKVNV